MKTLQFTKVINAPADRVWDVLWNKGTYSVWTKPFYSKGSSFMHSDWQIGGKTLFTDENKNGMVSTIVSKNEPYDVVFEHLGEVTNGVEDTTSDRVKMWAGSLEEYHLKENDGQTTLTASVQVGEQMEDMMNKGFTEGLNEVKRLAEEK